MEKNWSAKCFRYPYFDRSQWLSLKFLLWMICCSQNMSIWNIFLALHPLKKFQTQSLAAVKIRVSETFSPPVLLRVINLNYLWCLLIHLSDKKHHWVKQSILLRSRLIFSLVALPMRATMTHYNLRMIKSLITAVISAVLLYFSPYMAE